MARPPRCSTSSSSRDASSWSWLLSSWTSGQPSRSWSTSSWAFSAPCT
jgi:hypothetical protein